LISLLKTELFEQNFFTLTEEDFID